METAINVAEVTRIFLKPKRAIKIAANGPRTPNNAKRTANTDESSSVDQPNYLLRGCNIAPGKPRAAEVVSIAKKVTAAMTQA